MVHVSVRFLPHMNPKTLEMQPSCGGVIAGDVTAAITVHWAFIKGQEGGAA